MRQGSVLSPFLFAVYLDDIWDNRQIIPSYYVIIYADDILLISSSICELQRIFDICKRELMWLDVKQAQLSQKDRVTLRVIEYFAKSLKVTQGHSK